MRKYNFNDFSIQQSDGIYILIKDSGASLYLRNDNVIGSSANLGTETIRKFFYFSSEDEAKKAIGNYLRSQENSEIKPMRKIIAKPANLEYIQVPVEDIKFILEQLQTSPVCTDSKNNSKADTDLQEIMNRWIKSLDNKL